MFRKKVIISIRMDPVLVETLKNIQEKTGLTRSEIISIATKKFVANRLKGRKGKKK